MSAYVTLSCILALATSGAHGSAPDGGLVLGPSLDTMSYPRYSYNYGVNDPHTGDSKSQWESRDGDSVKGSYSLVEPDGRLRVVDYSADSVNGFNAVVNRVGAGLHPSPPLLTPLAVPAATLHASPPAHESYLTPVAISTANVIRSPGPSYPVVPIIRVPLHWGPIAHPAELPLQAGWGSPWRMGDEGVGWEEPEPLAAPPALTVSGRSRGRGGSKSWGPIQLADGQRIIIRHKY